MRTLIIENSKAPGAIGDSVASWPMLHALAWDIPTQVYLSAEKVRPLLYHPNITILEEKPEDGEVIDIQNMFPKYSMTGLSMPRAYLDYIGYPGLARSERNPEIILNVMFDDSKMGKGYDLLISPFSYSDFGTNTKNWFEYNWILLANEFLKRGKKVGLLGASKDSVENFDKRIDFILDRPLTEVCLLLREAKLVITVDNGIGWLCQGTKANHILLIPRTQHPNWTANPNKNALNLPLSCKVEDVLGAIQKRILEVKMLGL